MVSLEINFFDDENGLSLAILAILHLVATMQDRLAEGLPPYSWIVRSSTLV